MDTVTNINYNKSMVEIEFSSQEKLSISKRIFKEYRLTIGEEISKQKYLIHIKDSLYKEAISRAVNLLSFRARSIFEVKKVLITKYPENIVNSVIDRLLKENLLNDTEFAIAWAQARINSGLGKTRISIELKNKGISSDLIAMAFEANNYDEVAINNATVLATKIIKRYESPLSYADKQKVVQSLMRKGFNVSVSIKACNNAISLN